MSQTGPTILIVDDEVISLQTLARTLDEDFDVRSATCVADAQRLLEEQWVQVVISEQRLPDMTGVELLARVREQWPDVVRMFISGNTDADDIISRRDRRCLADVSGQAVARPASRPKVSPRRPSPVCRSITGPAMSGSCATRSSACW